VKLVEVSIKRHVMTYMISFAIILFGVIATSKIGVDRFPAIDFPMISVTTVMVGASPEIVDSSVTSIIESAVNTVPGLDNLRASSSPGVSTVFAMFTLDKNIDVAYNEVQSKINQAIQKLPREVETPIITKVSLDAQPIMWLVLKGDRTLQQLNQYSELHLKKRLVNISGVGEVIMGGKRARNIRVELDLQKMASVSITTQDIQRAFNTQHIQLPGGFLTSGGREHLINLDLEYHRVSDLKEMIVAYRNGQAIRLSSFANVRDALEDYRAQATFNGEPGVGLGVIKISGANSVAIIEEIKARLDSEIRPSLSPGLSIEIASDSSVVIEESVEALYEHLVLGTLLAALVVFVFLKSMRATFIISIAIPISLLGAIFVMFVFDYTFNMMTLLSLLLLIGIVVDDAIVVLENIHRHQEEGNEDPMQAAIEGTKEVSFAVLAATFTLVAIFAPVLFMTGIMGMFFEAFAMVVTLGVLVSLVVALTLTPMLCGRYLKVETEHGAVYSKVEAFFERMESGYKKAIKVSIRHRVWVLLGCFSIVVSSCGFFSALGKEFMPGSDEGQLTVIFRTPLGSGMEYSVSRLDKIEAVLASHPTEIASYFSAIGLNRANVNQGSIFVRLTPRAERSHQEELQKVLSKELAEIPGVVAFISRVSPIGGNRGEPLQFVLQGPNLNQIEPIANKVLHTLKTTPGMGQLDMALDLSLPQLKPKIDRIKVASLGLSARDVAFAVNVLAGGIDIAKFNDDPGDGERYDIRLKASNNDINSVSDLSNIYLRTASGEMVRLDTVATFEEEVGPAIIGKYNLKYSAQYFASPEMPLGSAVETVEALGESLPAGYEIEIVGQAKSLEETKQNMAFVFSLAIVLVYMVLASQFNSFSQPFIVMTAMPLAGIGGVFLLWITGHTLNIYSMIGLILLLGLVSKNSILLIDLTNQLRQKGYGIDEALLEACPRRMRPILMTSATVILALLPAALGTGAGSDTNAPLAVAVIGGMLSSTLLTLIVMPVVYSLWQGWLERRQLKKAASETNPELPIAVGE